MIPSYMDRYTIETRLGHPATDEDMARIHNGGPNGYSKMKSIKLSRVSVISVTSRPFLASSCLETTRGSTLPTHSETKSWFVFPVGKQFEV